MAPERPKSKTVDKKNGKWMRDCAARIRKRLHVVVLSPSYATLLTAIILFAGSFGSLYSHEIRSAFPFSGPASSRIAEHALVFWTLVVSTAFLFFARQQAIDRSRKAAEMRLEQQAQELMAVVRTQPPADFLALFTTVYDSCEKLLDGAKDPSVRDQPTLLAEPIRHVLRSFAILAEKFHGTKGYAYGANVMRFIPSAEAVKAEAAIKSRLKFCEPEVSLQSLLGILDLELDLSTTSTSSEAQKDDALVPLALPVPKKATNTARRTGESEPQWRLLPGAPMAYHSASASNFDDTRKVSSWMRELGDFTEEVTREVESYFLSKGRPILGSFISIPLLRYGSLKTQWVLNIHCDRPGLFQESRLEHFVPLVRPLEAILLRLLDEWAKAGTAA